MRVQPEAIAVIETVERYVENTPYGPYPVVARKRETVQRWPNGNLSPSTFHTRRMGRRGPGSRPGTPRWSRTCWIGMASSSRSVTSGSRGWRVEQPA